MIRHTASDHAPWYVVPADHKWFTRLVVAGAVIDALEELDLPYPAVDEHKREELRLVQAELERNGGGTKKAKDTAPPRRQGQEEAVAGKDARKKRADAAEGDREAASRDGAGNRCGCRR